MDKLNIIASIVEGETSCSFGHLMEDEAFNKLAHEVKHLDVDEATNQLISLANEIS
jgi:hypothetical protein